MRESQHRRTNPYTPKHNGKVERYNRIFGEELLYARTWRSEQERVNAVVAWNGHYNYHRPHGEQTITGVRIWVDDSTAFMDEVRKYL